MEANVNKQMTTQYIRNVINSFSKMGKDVAKDTLLPSTSSLVFNAHEKFKEIKDVKYSFSQLKDKLTRNKYYDNSNFDNIEEGIEKEYYQFGREVKNVSDKNIKYFTKNNVNLKVISADLISTEVTKTVKDILLTSNNILIDALGKLEQPVLAITDFQNEIKLKVYKDTTNNFQTILQMMADINNDFANFSNQKLNGIASDITKNRMESLIRVEKMFSMDELNNVFRNTLEKFGIDEEDSKALLDLTMRKPALGLLKTFITLNTDKNKGTILDDIKSIPKNVNNYLALSLNHLKDNENPVLRFLGEKFAPDKKDSEIIYRDNYHKESTKFDTNSKRAITHVIPTLLSQILNKLENRDSSEELVYDYDNGAFTTQGAVDQLKSKDEKVIQKRINNLEDANKQRKSVKNLIKYRERFSGATTTEYEKEEYEQTRGDFKIETSKKLNIVSKFILKIDNVLFNIEKPDSKLANTIEKVIGFANSLFDPATGMPSVENIKNAIIKPIKNKFNEYITSVKNYVKETYKIAVDSVVSAFKKPDDGNSVKFKDKLKNFVSEKILIPLGSKINDVKNNLLLNVKDKARLIVRVLKRKIEAKKGSTYISNANIKDQRDIDIDLKDDLYGFNLIKYNMLGIGIELSPLNNIINTLSSRIFDVMSEIKKRTKIFNKEHKDDKPKTVKPTFKILESAAKYTSYVLMFTKDVIKSLEPATVAAKGFQTLKRMVLNVLGTVTDAFVGIFKEVTKLVRNVISIFTEKIPAALKYIDRFTGTVATLMKSKLANIPMMAVKAIISGGTSLIHNMNNILIDASGTAIEFVGKAVRGLLVTARLLGNSLNKAMTMGKYYIKRVLHGRNPNINKLEFATITRGQLDEIKNLVTAEIVKKDTRHEDEKEDDQKDIQRVKNITAQVTGKISARVEERTEAVEDMLQKLITKPVQLVKGLFFNVIGFIMGGSVGTFIGNVAAKTFSMLGNTKIGRLFGLNKATQLVVKKVYIDGGSLDDESIVDGIIDGVVDGDGSKIVDDIADSKSITKKFTGFISKHKKGAIIGGLLAAGTFLFAKSRKNDDKEEDVKESEKPIETQSTAEPSNEKVNKEEMVKENGTTIVTPTSAVKSSSTSKKDDEALVETIMTEDDVKNSINVNTKVNDKTTIKKFDESVYKEVNKPATITPLNRELAAKEQKEMDDQNLNSFNNINKSANDLKDIYRSNVKTDVKNKSILYKKLNESDKELMLAQEGVQGIYRKTADPIEREKLTNERENYKGMINDFTKGFKYGGIIFGVINVLAKKVDLSKFRNLIKDKQNDIDLKTSIKKSLVGIGTFGFWGDSAIDDYTGGGYDGDYGNGGDGGGIVGPGGTINWPSGNMKLGEKMVMYARAFLPKGKLNYSQPLRDKIDNQGNRADCSSFVRHIYKVTTGINPGNTSREQDDAGTKVSSVSQLREGDILWKSGHVGMYAGGNKYIDVGGPTNGSNDPKWKDITSFNYFTMGRRVINPDQMVDNKLNNPNTAVTGLTGSGIQSGGTSNADKSIATPVSKIGDPAENEITENEAKEKSKAQPVTNTSSIYETKSLKDETRDYDNMVKKLDKNDKTNESIAKTQVKDMSLQNLVNQKITDNTLYSRTSTINRLQQEIVTLLQSIDTDIKSLLDIDNEMIVHLKQVEGL